ncbi:hypothetical protein PFISCL1PPCAC_25230, partial [Pristionchus fissidentatus]
RYDNEKRKVIDLGSNDNALARITFKGADNVKKTGEGSLSPDVFCMPTALLKPEDKFETNKNYDKMQYKFGEILCEQPLIFSTIEFFF